MDKLLPLIDWVKKNRFWLGCALLSVAMIATWFLITMQIAKQTTTFASDVTGQIQAANSILKVSAEDGAGAHPNSSTEEGMKTELKQSLDSLVQAWEIRHRAQQSILKWPTDVIGSEEFVKAFSRFDPPEKFPEKYSGGSGLERYLDLYRVTIPKQMDHICKDVVRTRWNFDPEHMKKSGVAAGSSESGGGRGGLGMGGIGGGRGMGGIPGGIGRGTGGRGGIGGPPGGGPNSSMGGGSGIDGSGPGGGQEVSADVQDDLSKYAVIWDDQNQAIWNRKLTEFKGLDDHFLAVDNPTPLQVYMLQQDLWLLEAMFTIIRTVNGDSNSNDFSAIKRIDHVAFGREARTQLGALTPFDPLLAGVDVKAPSDSGEEGNRGPSGAPSNVGGGRSVPGGVGEGSTTVVDPDGFDKLASFSPYHGRYVGLNFEPLTADIVRAVLTGEELPGANLELIVAKRVPVRIALRMDERKIPDFMTACANSPFAFEINQIRLNRHKPGEGIEFNGGGHGAGNKGGVSASGSMARDGGMQMDGSMGGMALGGSGGGAGGTDDYSLVATPVETRTNYDVDVEFYGIVKIYNPVREKFLRRAAGEDVGDPNPNDAADLSKPVSAATSKP